jgi:hypothetical protein
VEVVRRSALKLLGRLFTRENLLAGLICLLVVLVLIATTSSAPSWIYQGF